MLYISVCPITSVAFYAPVAVKGSGIGQTAVCTLSILTCQAHTAGEMCLTL